MRVDVDDCGSEDMMSKQQAVEQTQHISPFLFTRVFFFYPSVSIDLDRKRVSR